MGTLKLLLSISVATFVSGCASIPKSYQTNWVYIFNQSHMISERERAAALMPHHDYIRYSEQVARNYANPNLGSTPVTDLEREMVYFELGAQYLYDWQAEGKNADKARVIARKLLELPNLHTMSKFLIARVQELDGGDYNPHYVPVPRGAKMWLFSVGQSSNDKTELNFGNFQNEYEQILSEKQGGFLGKATQLACGALLLCITGVSSDTSLVIHDLQYNIYLDVYDHKGTAVQIGVSSWTVAKSQ